MPSLQNLTTTAPSEHDEQVGLLNWFRQQFPGVLIFAIPNGEKRAIAVARRLKAEGVVRGIPDLFVPEWDLWIEMKRTQGGRLSPEQRDIIRKLENMGHTVIVGIGATHASKLILDHVKKLLYMLKESE
jgi:hypothetical protein